MSQGTHQAHLELQEELIHRMKVDHIFEDLFGAISGNEEIPLPRNFDCLRSMVNAYTESCGKFSDYSLKYVKYLVNECEVRPNTVDSVIHRMKSVCFAQ